MSSGVSENEAYVVSFGAVPIRISEPLFSNQDPEKIKKNMEYHEQVYSDLINHLKKSPQVDDCSYTPYDQLKHFQIRFGVDNWVMRYFEPIKITFSFSNFLSKELFMNKYFRPYQEHEEFPSDLNVYYDGICYACFRKVDINKEIYFGGIDTRELLIDVLKTKFDLIRAAPTPFQLKYILYLQPHKDQIYDEIFERKDDYTIEVRTKYGIKDPGLYIKFFFQMTTGTLENYYSLTTKKSLQRNYADSIHLICQKILIKRSQAILLSQFRIIKKRETIFELKILVQDFFDNYSKWSEINSRQRRDVINFKENLLEQFNKNSDVIMKSLEDYEVPIETNLNVIELAQKDILDYQNAAGLWLTIIMSLICAFIGGFIGAII